MKRRNFIKTTASGSALLMAPYIFAFNAPKISNMQDYCFQSERKIPVAYQVDVLVVGGSAAGVSAAVQASLAGAKVLLVAQEPYLGEDICGTYRFWTEDKLVLSTDLGNKIFGMGLPTPMHVKRTLDNELINSNVDFLYSCYVTDVLTGNDGKPAGVVIANRSGRQAIVAKIIIDTTPRAIVARLAGAKFGAFPIGINKFKFTVVGNNVKNSKGLTAKIHNSPINFSRAHSGNANNSSSASVTENYQAIEYSLDVYMKDGSWKSFAEAEQVARDLTWDANQVDSADLLFQNPPDKLFGQKRLDNFSDVNADLINLKAFRPQKIDTIFVLSGSADLSDNLSEILLEPGKLIRIGERIGKEAAKLSMKISFSERPNIIGKKYRSTVPGDVGELLGGLRSTSNGGQIVEAETTLPVLARYDVVVVGGGTAGSPAGVGASKNGASTLVIEYLHGLGGIGTMGLIGKYWDGYRAGYTLEVDYGVRVLGGNNPRQKQKQDEWVFDWKIEYFRREIRESGGEIWFGVLGIGAYVDKGTVKGVVVATPAGKGIVLAHTVIDSTGSADIAIAAGAGYEYTDGFSVAVQGAGMTFKNPNDHYNNTDWTFTNDTDMLDVWRTFVVAKDKFTNKYDLGKLPQTRERRRIIGDYTVSVLDIYNKRTYPDTFSIHISSFDTHGYTEDPFFSLRPPDERTKHITALVPFRALLPKGIQGISVTGLGASAHRDAMPVIRMQSCLQNQGFSMGWAAALAAQNNQHIRDVDLRWLQTRLAEMKNLPEEVLYYQDNYPPSLDQLQRAAKSVVNNLEGLEVLLWDTNRTLPILEQSFQNSSIEDHRLVYARILGMLGNSTGWQVLCNAVDQYQEWDDGWNYRGMHQFGKSLSYLDSLIIALGRTKVDRAYPSIARMANKLIPASELSHFHAIAISLESIGHKDGANVLFKLLNMPGIMGHAMTDIRTAKKITPENPIDNSTRNNSLRELFLGRALFRVGDKNGLGKHILETYSKDLRGHYYRHANGVLEMFKR